MEKIDGMRLFARVAETGSFSRGASSVGVSQSTASRAISAMEARLGMQLVRRTTRGMSLTEAGLEYYEATVHFLAGLEAAESAFAGDQTAPGGMLRVALSAAFGRTHVIPHMAAFLDVFPDIRVEFDVSDKAVDLREHGADVALRVGPMADTLAGRRIGSVACVTVASAACIARHGAPVQPEDVGRMPCVVFSARGASKPWRFWRGNAPLMLEPRAVMRSSEAEQVRCAVLQGLGLGQGPAYLYADDLRTGALVQILTDFVPPASPVVALYAGGRRPSRKAEVFVDFVAKAMESASRAAPVTMAAA